MLCVKATFQLHQRQIIDGDISEPQPAPVVQKGPWERVGIERVRDDPPFPVHTAQVSSSCCG